MAAIRYRVQDLKADRILYVVGADQALHFRWCSPPPGWRAGCPTTSTPSTSSSASMLGSDGSMFKTRSRRVRQADRPARRGRRARAVGAPRRPRATTRPRAPRSRTRSGIGAVKYADLSVSHDSDYVFDFDRMLALHGNTGPYMQYATARIRSIFRKAGHRRRREATASDRARPSPPSAPWRCSCSASATIVERGRGTLRAAPARRLPVRDRQRLHHLLRAVPGAEGRRRRRTTRASGSPCAR